ncbi:BN860_09120g1_1 [Zygosaccharomyces bailii CLIB 213]|uniref:tRNA (adenine(58)-N(1))-methyltransferase catalytic subunit TRM61 n=1 Tax=Zygosaccharomyces bailii (strain CLIB 213 / ATCC 58445 / CBS 680 / BCRC 21525 / NBRC 1098 / NCYC 1416 / NRRL Y-2227) TaxID=1333698 RepID=A0A8J2T5I0_ZYGB2|nr:BN860_09120g1_1 [Zygosaccharomyces bailii CLIB 213]
MTVKYSKICLFSKRFQHTFQPFDIVLARSLAKPNEKFHLSQPLQAGKTINTGNGPLKHEDIIGKPYRSLLTTAQTSSHKYMLCKPTMEDYIVNRRREAQPIYSLDAGLIVQLSDIHVDFPEMEIGDALTIEPPHSFQRLHIDDPFDERLLRNLTERYESLRQDLRTRQPPKQYMECGTGHGSLTLNICRAIHSGNAFYNGNNSTRGAILHSLDRNEKHLSVGIRNLKHYEKGMYWPDVEFHLLNNMDGPTLWLKGEVGSYYRDVVGCQNAEGFLSGAFLDMPSPELHLSAIASNLLTECPLVVFVPSVMQLWDCLSLIKRQGIPLSLTRVCELMAGSGGGGMREWDLRRTFVRETGQESMVVRPKVGIRVVGGGFIGLFKKLPADSVVKQWT